MIPLKCQTCIAPVHYKGRSLMQRLTSPFDGVRSRGKAAPGTGTPLRIKSLDEENLEFLAEPQAEPRKKVQRAVRCWRISTTAARAVVLNSSWAEDDVRSDLRTGVLEFPIQEARDRGKRT